MRGRAWVLMASMILVAASACTKRNPAVCCSTAPECEEIGFDEITPCEGLKVCIEGSCESPTCTTSAECSEPAPYCVNMVCTATCTADPDCVGVPGLPHCAPDGACVACVDSSQCTDQNAAVCDDATHACRQCTDDNECASGICLGMEGTCGAEPDIVYIATGGNDSGECRSESPCRTIAYGLTKITAQRRVLRLVDLDFIVPDGITIAQSVYVDGATTRISRTSTGPIITVENGATVTLEGLRVEGPTSVPAIHVLAMANVVIASSLIAVEGFTGSGSGALLVEEQGSLRITRSQLDGLGVSCVGSASLEMDESRGGPHGVYLGQYVGGDFCFRAKIHHNRFDGLPISLISRSTVVFENNLVTASSPNAVAVAVQLARSGTAIRFNTFVSDGGPSAALRCSGQTSIPVATSNLFAWQSSVAIETPTNCEVRNSLFDADATAPPGMNNVTGVAFDDIFVSAATGDFHLSNTSPAREAAEAIVEVSDDLEHTLRPQPTGTNPDIGSYEAP